MNIQVKSFLSKEQAPIIITLPEGAVLKQIRENLDDKDVLVLVNGVVRPDNYPVSVNDVISIMPILAGG